MTQPPPKPLPCEKPAPASPVATDRRGFMALLSWLLGGVMTAALAIPGVRYLADPLRRRGVGDSFTRVAPLSAVPEDRPVRVAVIEERRDAFTRYPPSPVGAVWLVRSRDDQAPGIRCFQSICPHLGCGIDYAADQARFACLCHASDFSLEGRVLGGPAPRDMDELACRLTPPDERGEIWVEVQYRRFRIGIPTREPIA